MKTYWKWKAFQVARQLVKAEAIYSTRIAIHGRSAYIYAHELSEMKGECEVLIWELEWLNERLKGKKC